MRHLEGNRQTIIFGLMIIASLFVSLSLVSAGFGYGDYNVPGNNIMLNYTIYYNSSALAGDLNVNRSNFWDNLDTPTDIPGSEYWYNQTTDANAYCDSRTNMTFNQSLTDSLYASATAGNATFNQTLTDILYIPIGENISIWAAINAWGGVHNGTDGTNGTNGFDGTNGTNGIDGTNGTNGIDGLNGTDGINGTNGVDGTNGTNGVDGLNGTDGQNGTFLGMLNDTQFLNNGTFWTTNLSWMDEFILSYGFLDSFTETEPNFNGNWSLIQGAFNNNSYLSTANATTDALIGQNTTMWNLINQAYNNASYLSTYNATYDGITNNWNGNYSLLFLFNKTYADTLYAPINYGDNWNKTYADTLYHSKSANLDMTTLNITWTAGDKIYDNTTCVVIQGGTSSLYVC